MSALTFFYQECPVCGRSLRVRVQYFGKQMSCTHCGGEFQAGPNSETHSTCGERHVGPTANGFITHGRLGMPQLGGV
jgi:hypothetical protein